MGNYRFRFSDMIPNAWFYKLKDMSKTRKNYPMKKNPSSSPSKSQTQNSNPKYSYYFTTQPLNPKCGRLYNSPVNLEVTTTRYLDPPRKSSKRRDRRRTIYKPSPRVVSSVSTGFNCHAILNPVPTNSSVTDQSPECSLSPFETSPESESLPSESEEDDFFVSYSNSSTTDIIIDVKNESHARKFDMVDGYDAISELKLPPIVTQLPKFEQKDEVTMLNLSRNSSKLERIKSKPRRSVSVKIVKEESVRKSFSNSPGIRLRANSPRIASKKIQAHGRKSISSKCRNRSISESLAVVKSSFDPQGDFRDSMVEMIMENNIRESKDLEDLLACYLSLNSNRYHDFIIKAFEQIWLDLTNLSL